MKLNIYHTNDIHSNFEFTAKVSSYMKHNKKEEDLYLDSGDFNDLKDLIVQADRGKSAMELFFKTGLDLMTFGNNEIDMGCQSLQELIDLNFPIVCANLRDLESRELKGLESYRIIEKAGIRFLIIGVSPYYDWKYTPGSYNNFFSLNGLLTIEPIEKINQILDEEEGNFDYSILLTHSGLRIDQMIKDKCPRIDLMLGGHTHNIISDGAYSQSGRGEYLGRIGLEIVDGKIQIVDNVQLNLTKTDPDFLLRYQVKKEYAVQKLSQEIEVVGELDFDPFGECEFINYICDCLLKDYEADFAIMHNGISEGALRRPVSKLSLLELMPSKLNPTIFPVKGKNIVKAIWQSFDENLIKTSGAGAGFRGSLLGSLGYSSNVLVNMKTREISINGALIENERTYTVVSDDYLQRGTGYRDLKARDELAVFNGDFIRDLVEKHLMDEDLFEKAKIKRII